MDFKEWLDANDRVLFALFVTGVTPDELEHATEPLRKRRSTSKHPEMARKRRERLERVMREAGADRIFFESISLIRARHPKWTWEHVVQSIAETWESDCERNAAWPMEDRFGGLIKAFRGDPSQARTAIDTIRVRYHQMRPWLEQRAGYLQAHRVAESERRAKDATRRNRQ